MKKVQNIFKVNNIDIRTMSFDMTLVSLLQTWNIFYTFFTQVNVCWDFFLYTDRCKYFVDLCTISVTLFKIFLSIRNFISFLLNDFRKVKLSPSKKKILFTSVKVLWKRWKRLFISCFWDIYILVPTFCLYAKAAWYENYGSLQNLQIITKHILPNISRSKDNHVIKFIHLVEYNQRNIFLETLYTKYGGEKSPRPFYKKLKLSVSPDNQMKC